MPSPEGGYRPPESSTSPSTPELPEVDHQVAIDLADIEQRYADLEQQYQQRGAPDEDVDSLQRQRLAEIKATAATLAGLSPSLDQALSHTLTLEQTQRINSQPMETPIMVENLNGQPVLVRQSHIAGTDLTVIRLFNQQPSPPVKPPPSLAQRAKSRLGLSGRPGLTKEQQQGLLTQAILVRNTQTGQVMDLGQRTPCILEGIWEHSPEDASRHLRDVSFGQSRKVIDHPTAIARKGQEEMEVVFSEAKSINDLASLLHEIGHAWDRQVNFDLPRDNLVSRERNAWAWAIREVRRWQEAGFSLPDSTMATISQDAELCLSTYNYRSVVNKTPEAVFTSAGRKYSRTLDSLSGLALQFSQLASSSLVEKTSTNHTVKVETAGPQVKVTTQFQDSSGQQVNRVYEIAPRSLKFSEQVVSTDQPSVPAEKSFYLTTEVITTRLASMAPSAYNLKVYQQSVAELQGIYECVDYLKQLVEWLESDAPAQS